MNPQQPQYRPQPHQQPAVPQPVAPPQQSYGQPAPGGQGQPQSLGPDHDFSFIMEPANPFKQKTPLIGDSSMGAKLAVVGGVIVVLLILFVLGKAVLGGGSSLNTTQLMAVAEDQQELVHLTANSNTKVGLANGTINSIWTIQVSAGESEAQLLAYLKANGYKVATNLLITKESAATDTQLSNAYANGTYDQTYDTVVQGVLATYEQDLQAAYQGDHGAKGRQLLSSDYTAARLLSTQISSPAS